MEYQDITLQETELLKNKAATVLVDVREDWEFEEFNIGGMNIPLSEIRQRRDELAAFDTIIVVCTNGIRSKVAAMDYCRVASWSDKTIYHLKGGILEAE